MPKNSYGYDFTITRNSIFQIAISLILKWSFLSMRNPYSIRMIACVLFFVPGLLIWVVENLSNAYCVNAYKAGCLNESEWSEHWMRTAHTYLSSFAVHRWECRGVFELIQRNRPYKGRGIHVYGGYSCGTDAPERVIHITQGNSGDHRSDVNEVVQRINCRQNKGMM